MKWCLVANDGFVRTRTWQLHRQSSAKLVKADIEREAAEVRIADLPDIQPSDLNERKRP
jgi:hypothetical protein